MQRRQACEGDVETIREEMGKLKDEHAKNYKQKQKLQRENDVLSRENQNLKSEVSRLIILQADSNTRHTAMKASTVVNETIKNWTIEHAMLRKQHIRVLNMLRDYETLMRKLAEKMQEGGWEDGSFRASIQDMMKKFCRFESIHDAIDQVEEEHKNRRTPKEPNLHGI